MHPDNQMHDLQMSTMVRELMLSALEDVSFREAVRELIREILREEEDIQLAEQQTPGGYWQPGNV